VSIHTSWVKLKDVCQTTSGGTPSRDRADFYGGDIPWVKSGELKDGWITDSEEKITQAGFANSSAKKFPAGTLLIALYGATVGKLGILVLQRKVELSQAG
jgi:type I restriction enzyme S subunit